MAINVGSAEITVDADTRPFLTGLQRTMASAARSTARSASGIGKKIGSSMGESMSKNFDKAAQGIGKVFFGKIAMIAAAVPLATSGISALAGAATALTGSLLRAAIQSAAFVGVMGAMVQGALVAKMAFKGMGDAIGGDEEAMKKLAPSAQAVVKSLQSLAPAWKRLQTSIQQRVFAGLADDVRAIGGTLLPILQQKLGATADIVNHLFENLRTFVKSRQFVQQFGNALDGNNKIFDTLRKVAVPLLDGLLNLYRALQPAAGKLATNILKATRGFRDWAEAGRKSGSIGAYMDKAAASFHQVWRVVRNLGKALWNITQIGADSGDSLMKKFGDLAGTFMRFTKSAEGKSSIANWINQGVAAVTKLGQILGTMGGVFSALFNPAIINTFLDIINGLIPSIKTVAGVIASALQPVLAALGPAMAELGPKIAKLFVALAPLLKGIGAVLGAIITQVVGTISTVLSVITPVIAIISNILGPILTKFAPIIAFIILLFVNWGSALVKIAPMFGKFLGPLVKGLGKAFQLISKVIGMIGKALKPLAPIFAKVFGLIASYFGSIVTAAKWLWDVLFGGSIFPDIIKAIGIFVGLFKGYIMLWVNVFQFIIKIVIKVGQVIAQIFRAIGSVIKTVVSAIWNFIKAAFTKIGSIIATVLRTAWNIVRQVWNGIKAVVSAVVNGLKAVISRNFNFYKSIITKVMNVIKAVVTRVWTAVKSKVTTVVNGIKSTISNVFNSIKGVVTNAWNAVKTATQNAWDSIKNAVVNKVQSVVNTAKGIKDKVLTAMGNLTSALTQKGRDLIQGLIDGIGEKIQAAVDKVKEGLNKIKGMLPGSPIREGPLRAWNNGRPGKALMQGLADGIAAGTPAVVGAAEKSANGVLNGYVKTFEIGSPSKKTKKYGAWVVDGLVEGLSSGQEKATATFEALWKKMKKAGEKGALRVIKNQRNAIKVASEALKANSEALAHWAGELDTYTQAWASTYDSMVETFSHTTAFDGGLATVEDITAQLNDTVAQTERMQAAMNSLAAKGLDPKLIEQLASAGLSGLSSAEALAGASAQQIADMNAAQVKLNTMAAGIGTTTANALYKAKKDEAQLWVTQLQNAMPGLKKNMRDLADEFITAMNKAIDKTKGGYSSEAQAAKDEKKEDRKKKKHPRHAAGTWDFSGGMTWVGEKGPELVNVPRHTQILNDKMLNQVGGGGTTVVNVAMTVSVDDLAKMGQVSDFLNMLNLSRMTSRKTARSGTVTA